MEPRGERTNLGIFRALLDDPRSSLTRPIALGHTYSPYLARGCGSVYERMVRGSRCVPGGGTRTRDDEDRMETGLGGDKDPPDAPASLASGTR